MKKCKKIIAVLCLYLVLSGLFSVCASAAQGTTYTYTVSNNGDYIRTQEAYVPTCVYLKDAELSEPNDLFIKDNIIYIADTGNARILIFNITNSKISQIKYSGFVSPVGVFVTNGKIYVADKDAPAVFVFDTSGKFCFEIKKPTDSPLMNENTVFKPTNVAVSSENNIFVVGESSYDGIMQFSQSGDFEGYFAANKRSLTFLETVEELIFTDEQKAQKLTRKPRAIQNIDISDRDLIFSVTQSAEVSYSWSKAETKTSNALKLHNLAGTNIISTNSLMNDEWNFVDVASGHYGNSYALTYTGLIYEYDSQGNLIFSFGGRAVSSDRYGLFTYAQAIDLDKNGFIYVLDKERALVQVFVPTDFAVLTHKAVYDLENGNYEQSETNWHSILQLNGMSRIAHIGYGKSLMRQQRYGEACKHFKIANDKADYSECFWEIRDRFINKYIIYAVALAFILLIYVMVKQMFFKTERKKVYSSYGLQELSDNRISRFTENFKFSFMILKHPVDVNEYLKIGKRGDMVSSIFLLLITYAVYLCDMLKKGFLFNSETPLSLFMLSLLFFIVFFLFAIGNYMTAAINDGEGSLKKIIIMLSNALIPYTVLIPVSIALSYVLTLNEGFLITLIWTVGVTWSAVLVFIGVIKIHNYTFKQAVKNIFLTVIFMILALVVVAVLYLVWDKVADFVRSVASEVVYRAKN